MGKILHLPNQEFERDFSPPYLLIPASPGRENSARRWEDGFEHDMWVMGLDKVMAMDRETWKKQIYGLVNPYSLKGA